MSDTRSVELLPGPAKDRDEDVRKAEAEGCRHVAMMAPWSSPRTQWSCCPGSTGFRRGLLAC